MGRNLAELGGGVVITSATLLLQGVDMYDNRAAIQGGALTMFEGGSIAICHALVRRNDAQVTGGAIALDVRGRRSFPIAQQPTGRAHR